MQNIIDALYNGQFNPAEQIFQHDRQYRKYLKKQGISAERLCLSLNVEQQRLFEEYCNLRNQTDAYLHWKLFRSGFRTGAKILLEIVK